MIESTFQALAWLSSCWLHHMEFDSDNSHLLQLMFEMHKKLQTSKLEFGLNSKAF